MEYRTLGRNGVRVSEIALGSWMTQLNSSSEVEAARDTLRLGYEFGVNFFDCADAYGAGTAERFLGEVLGEFPRNSYVVASKVFFPSGDGPNDRGLSRKHIRHQVEKSLQNLRVDYLDIYFCHRFDSSVPLHETLQAMSDLVVEGKVLYYGVSEWTAVQLLQGQRIITQLGLRPISVIQPQYNMIDRYIEHDLMEVCEGDGIGVVAFSPLAQGLLSGKYRPGTPPPPGSRATTQRGEQVHKLLTPDNLAKVERLSLVAHRLGIELSVMALAWTLRRAIVSSVVTGASTSQQLEKNIAASGVVLPSDALDEIDDILQFIRFERTVG